MGGFARSPSKPDSVTLDVARLGFASNRAWTRAVGEEHPTAATIAFIGANLTSSFRLST
jgi:hypothetical protein